MSFSPLPFPPRLLAAASVAVGTVQMLLVYGWLVPFELGEIPAMLRLRAAVVAVVFNLAFLLAPFLIARGDWRSLAAGLLVAVALYGWVATYLPAGFDVWPLAILASLSAAVLAALFVLAVWALAKSFLAGRKGGSAPRPDR